MQAQRRMLLRYLIHPKALQPWPARRHPLMEALPMLPQQMRQRNHRQMSRTRRQTPVLSTCPPSLLVKARLLTLNRVPMLRLMQQILRTLPKALKLLQSLLVPMPRKRPSLPDQRNRRLPRKPFLRLNLRALKPFQLSPPSAMLPNLQRKVSLELATPPQNHQPTWKAARSIFGSEEEMMTKAPALHTLLLRSLRRNRNQESANQGRRYLQSVLLQSSDAVRMERPRRVDRSTKVALCRRRARKPNMVAVRMEFLQRRAPRIEDVPNRNARNRCSDAVRISLHHRKATTLRDAQWRPLRLVDALLANTDAVRMGLPKRRELTIRVVQELRNRRRLNQRKRSLNRARNRKKRDAALLHMVAVRMALRQLADRMEKVVQYVLESRLDAVPMDRHQRMDLTARDVAWRLRTDAARITSTLLVGRIWKDASASIHRTDAVRITRPPLVVTTTRAVGVSIRSMVVAQIRRQTLQGPTLRDVRAMRSSLDAVRMVSHRPRDRTTMVAIARTASSSVARMDRRQRRVRILRVALVLPASTDAAQMESTKRREASSKAAKWYPSLPRRLACSRRTWARVTTTPSSTSSTSSTEAVDDSGTVDAVETRTGSIRPMSARMCAKHRKERSNVNCQRSLDPVPGTTRCGTTTPIGTRAHSSRTEAAWVTRTGSKRWTIARARAWWMIQFHLVINRRRADPATEPLNGGTLTRSETRANRSTTEAARATRTTIRRRVPATTTARNPEYTNKRTSASNRRRLASAKTTRPIGTLTRRSLAVGSSTMEDAAETVTTLSMKRPVTSDAFTEESRNPSHRFRNHSLNQSSRVASISGIASWNRTPVIASASSTNADTTTTETRAPAWTLRTLDAPATRTTSAVSKSVTTLVAVRRMPAACGRPTDAARRMKLGGTTTAVASDATSLPSADVTATPTTSTPSRSAPSSVEAENPNRHQLLLQWLLRTEVFATSLTTTERAIRRPSCTCSTRNAPRANRTTTAERAATETGLARRRSASACAESIEELMFASTRGMPDHVTRRFHASSTTRGRLAVTRSTTAAVKATETGSRPSTSAKTRASSKSTTRLIPANATTTSADGCTARTEWPDRTTPTTVSSVRARSHVLSSAVRRARSVPSICRVIPLTEVPCLWPSADQPRSRVSARGWSTLPCVRTLAVPMPTVATITSAVRLAVLRFAFLQRSH
uniref:(northern house mosquito) hypothetical protein n=1 Tax=Culex pipiens TaxID=7175 RepID=A0A8D8CUB1_CULPI